MVRTDSPPMPLGDLGSEVDEELLALPDPPRRERTLTVCALVVAAAVALAFAFSLRHDVVYALSRAEPIALGSLQSTHDAPTAGLPVNRVVTAEAVLGLTDAVRFERPFVEDGQRLVPVLGRDDLWVELSIPKGQTLGRFVPPDALRGRLVPFAEAGPHHRGLASALAEQRGRALPDGAMLIVQGEEPSSLRGALVGTAAAVLAALYCVWTAARLARRVTPS